MFFKTPAFALATSPCPFRGTATPRAKVSHQAVSIRHASKVHRVRMCDSSSEPAAEASPSTPKPSSSGPFSALTSWWVRISAKRAGQKAAALRNYGLAAVISYGLFDAVTYTLSFLFSLRAYLAAGKILTWKTLPQVLALMWGINNLSRPFRIAGALALAPVVDRRIVKPAGRFLTRLRKGDSPS